MSLTKKILAGFSLLTHPAKVRHTPIQANIEVTNSCNLDCIMCDRANTIGKGDMMSLDTFKSVIDQVNPSTVNLSGNGEPLLNKHVYSMIHYAKTKGIHTQMTSNFTGVSAKAQEICQSGLDFLKVSIDGTQDETFQTVRGVVLDKIIEGIEELARVRETSNRETPLLRINMVVLDINAGELEAMVELAYKHSIDSVQYKWCQTFNLQKEEVTRGITVEDMNKEIEQAKATSKRLGISTNLHL